MKIVYKQVLEQQQQQPQSSEKGVNKTQSYNAAGGRNIEEALTNEDEKSDSQQVAIMPTKDQRPGVNYD